MDPIPPSRPESAVKRWLRAHAEVVAAVAIVALAASAALGVAWANRGAPPEDPPFPDPGATTPSVPRSSAPLIAVKVDNAPRARPQIGLDSARYVVEVPVEGGLTRFLALFEPGDTLVGPVRSARPVDVDLVPAFTDVLVSTGGRPFVLGPLRDNGVRLVGADPEDPPFQSLERPIPHNQFVSLAVVPEPGSAADGFPGGEWPEPVSQTSATVDVEYATPVSWSFADGLYTRTQEDETFLVLPDWDTEPEPLTVETVVVMAVNPRSAGYTDVNGADVPTFDVIGSGRLWIHHGGGTLEGQWHRASLADGYDFTSGDGGPVGIPSGRTFVHLVPRSTPDG